ncbi:hypothetical protein NT6N_00100 [Oceaniferula spumae]|uniref:PepSY domain-containing protein n=1 Tax=Oceaniferula spumae TaxID=2979115 RepID=A0AAT9FG71_9BACT
MKTILGKFAATSVAALAMTIAVSAQVNNTKEALAVALKNETVAAGGEKMKLYAVSGNYNGTNKRWSFQFYDGGANVHSVSVDEKGKANYYSREKGSTRVFDDLDFSKLPAPSEVLVEDAIGKAKTALEALGFKPITDGKLYISYYVRSEYRQKDVPVHDWKVTLPIGDGKQGKMVGFKNGGVDTVMNSTIRN